MKYYILAERRYGDFDMPYEIPRVVSADKHKLIATAEAMNSIRTDKQLADEIKFVVMPDTVKMI